MFKIDTEFGTFSVLVIDPIMYSGRVKILQKQSIEQLFQTDSVRNQFVVRTVM